MAQPDMAQSDIGQLTGHLTGAAHQLSLFSNIPAINQGNLLNDQLKQLSTSFQKFLEENERRHEQNERRHEQNEHRHEQSVRFQQDILRQAKEINHQVAQLNIRLDVRDANNTARLHNIEIIAQDMDLQPLQTRENAPVPGFPRNLRQLSSLPGPQLSTLLQAYRLSTEGNVGVRRKRLREFVGVVMEV